MARCAPPSLLSRRGSTLASLPSLSLIETKRDLHKAPRSATVENLGPFHLHSDSASTSEHGVLTTSLSQLSVVSTESVGEVNLVCGKKAFADKGFNIKQSLGCGSMGAVYLVTRESDGKDFAAKRVASSDREHHEFTRNEYALMKELDHPSIVRAEELHCFSRDSWLVMDLCPNGSVQAYVKKRGAFMDSRCRDLSWQLLDGVRHLHEKRLVHRDIKPENLLLKNDALQLQIGDFNSTTKIGIKGQAVWMLSDRGTPVYTAPELRLALHWNERVDVWASGLAIFYMAQAKLPFAPFERETTAAWRRGVLPAISWGTISNPLANLVLQCLTVDVGSRPPAMELVHHPAFDNIAAVTPKAKGPGARRRAASQPARRSTPTASEEGCEHVDELVGGSEGSWQSSATKKLAKRRYLWTAGKLAISKVGEKQSQQIE